MNESSAVDKIVPKKVRPQRVAARRQQELLCVMAFQELEWHALDDVILRVMLKASMSLLQKVGTPILTNKNPIWEY